MFVEQSTASEKTAAPGELTAARELSPDELEAALAAQAAHVDAGLCRLLELAEECERRLDWAGGGTTFATWLAWRCALLPRQAREHERVASRLVELPLIHEAFARGELSYAKVGVLVRVAAPESERELLELAAALTASQLQRAVAAYERVTTEAAAERQEREFVTWFWTEDGSLALRALLAPEDGALVLRALEAARDALRERRRAASETEITEAEITEAAAAEESVVEPPEQPGVEPVSQAEALVAMADLSLANAAADRTGAERHELVVHVDAQTLAAGADGRCELSAGASDATVVPLAPETARRLACDASIVTLIERDGRQLALGRKRRSVSPALRRALETRDRGCRYPGCNSTRFVEAHHIEHWARGGATDLANLILLCRRHHRLLHEQGYSLELDDRGEPRFVNRHGVPVPGVPRPPPPSRADALPRRHRHLAITGETTWSGTGDRGDLGLVVDAITAAATDSEVAA
jgi:hypothetical protein